MEQSIARIPNTRVTSKGVCVHRLAAQPDMSEDVDMVGLNFRPDVAIGLHLTIEKETNVR